MEGPQGAVSGPPHPRGARLVSLITPAPFYSTRLFTDLCPLFRAPPPGLPSKFSPDPALPSHPPALADIPSNLPHLRHLTPGVPRLTPPLPGLTSHRQPSTSADGRPQPVAGLTGIDA